MGKDGKPVIALIVLAVCGIHEDVVSDFAQQRAVSEGFLINFDGVSELIELLEVNRRVDPDAISNVEGPLLVA
jgi:hypothetical protein